MYISYKKLYIILLYQWNTFLQGPIKNQLLKLLDGNSQTIPFHYKQMIRYIIGLRKSKHMWTQSYGSSNLLPSLERGLPSAFYCRTPRKLND